MCRSLAEEVDPLTTGTFRLPEDALPPLAYVAPEAPSAAPAAGWDMSGYRLQTLSPTPSEADAAEAAERERELGPNEPIVSVPNDLVAAAGSAAILFKRFPDGKGTLRLSHRQSLWHIRTPSCCCRRAATCGAPSPMGHGRTRRPSTSWTFLRRLQVTRGL